MRLKRKRVRHEARLFLTEGEDLLDAALVRGIVPRQVFLLEDGAGGAEAWYERIEAAAAPGPGRPRQECDAFLCSEPVLARLSQLGSGSRAIAVFAMVDAKFPGSLKAAGRPVVYLAGTGDPGNVGTLIRAAAALGARAVVMGPGTADPYAAKALRATMGSIFQVPFYLTVNPDTLVNWAGREHLTLVGADAHMGGPVWQAHLGGAFVLAMGSEREGLPRRIRDAADEMVRIPQEEDTESINVAMAGTTVLYEALRQRGEGG